MVLFVWNVWGMNKDLKIREIISVIIAKRIEVIDLNETKIKVGKQMEVKEKWGSE